MQQYSQTQQASVQLPSVYTGYSTAQNTAYQAYSQLVTTAAATGYTTTTPAAPAAVAGYPTSYSSSYSAGVVTTYPSSITSSYPSSVTTTYPNASYLSTAYYQTPVATIASSISTSLSLSFSLSLFLSFFLSPHAHTPGTTGRSFLPHWNQKTVMSKQSAPEYSVGVLRGCP